MNDFSDRKENSARHPKSLELAVDLSVASGKILEALSTGLTRENQLVLEAALKSASRTLTELCARSERNARECEAAATRQAQLSAEHVEALCGYLDFIRTNPVGAWSSASDGRVYFVAYERKTVDFWHLIEAMEKTLSDEMRRTALPGDFPLRADKDALAELSCPALIVFLARILREERIHDGAFLSAAESGALGSAIECLLEKSSERHQKSAG